MRYSTCNVNNHLLEGYAWMQGEYDFHRKD